MTAIPLTVETAQITTAAVEIKTLTVRGKQVTLAVFRQLMSASLVDRDTGELNGTPWGVVNYHADKCADDGEHLHVVWQRGSELRRATEYRHRLFLPEVPVVSAEAAEAWLHAVSLTGWRPKDAHFTAENYRLSRHGRLAQLKLRFNAGAAWLDVPRAVTRFWAELESAATYTRGPRREHDQNTGRWEVVETEEETEVAIAAERKARTEATYAELRSAIGAGQGPDLEKDSAAVEAEITAHLALRTKLAQRWEELVNLPQLFIAA